MSIELYSCLKAVGSLRRIKAFLLLMMLCAISASAEVFSFNEYRCETINATECRITAWLYSSGTANIPTRVRNGNTYYNVVEIGPEAFLNKTGLSDVVIPSTIRKIGKDAFKGCKVYSADFESVEQICKTEFVSMNSNPLFNGSYMRLKGLIMCDADIPEGVTSIGNYAFVNLSSLHTVTFPKTLVSIGDYAFTECKYTTFPSIPSSVRYIGYGAFSGCQNLTSIRLPNLTEVADCAFFACYSLTSVQFSSDITTIGESAFACCTKLSQIEIPASVKTIKAYAFLLCNNLNGSLTLPENLEYIGDGAFQYCDRLNGTLLIPEKVTYIGAEAFKGCKKITRVMYEAKNATVAGTVSAPVFPTTIKQINFGKKVNAIPANSFCGLTELTSNLTIPDNVTSIGVNAFAGCSGMNMVKLYLGSGLTSIGANAFANCNLRLGIELNRVVPPNVDASSFETVAYSVSKLYVPKEAMTTYKAHPVWGKFREFEVLPVMAKSISLNMASTSITEGASIQLMATVKPDDTSDKTAVWATSDAAVANVNADGIVSVYKPGTATISAMTTNEKVAECAVIVLPKEIPADGISLDVESTQLTVGETVKLIATVTPDNATDKSVVWSSSNEKVASVSTTGKVSALSSGEAVITATTSNGISAQCALTVNPIKPESVTLNIAQVALEVNDAIALKAKVMPTNAENKKLTWMSSDESVAIVNAEGTVTALSSGEATITATTVNGLSAQCAITVNPILPEGIILNIVKAEIEIGESLTLVAKVMPEDAEDKSITWSSDNEEVAIVNQNGEVTAVAPGDATITACSSNGVEVACCITVPEPQVIEPDPEPEPQPEPEVVKLKLDITHAQIVEGSTLKLTATINIEKALAWDSSDESVATVNDEGVVTAISPGIAKITVATDSGESVTAEITVKSSIIPGEAISITTESTEMEEGGAIQLVSEVLPANASDQNVMWESSNDRVVSVSHNGHAVAVSPGSAILTASTAEGLSAEISVTVIRSIIEPSEIVLSEGNLEVTVGERAQLTAKVIPVNADDQSIEWSSSDESVAIVLPNGVVTVVSAGKAKITATAANGILATCTVVGVPVVTAIDGLDGDVKGLVKIEGRDIIIGGDGIATVYNLSGMQIATTTNGKITDLPAGTYLIHLPTATLKLRL